MFERFTDRARRVIVLAQEEARALQHNYIGTEHLLLGLIREGEGVAAKALEAKGVTLEDTRKQVEEMIGKGNAARMGTSHLLRTPSRCWSFRCARRCSWGTATSAPNTFCSA